MIQRFQRLAAAVAAIAFLVPASVFAENRSRGRTDLERLAAELEQRLGKGSVVIEGSRSRPRPSAPSDTVVRVRSSEEAILAAMNLERASRGLRPLRINERLSLAAGDRVRDMFAKGYFDHVSPDGVQPFVWASQRGYRYSLIGENLAVGYRGAAVVDGWMRSPGHRENVLMRDFDEVGIAIADGSPRRGYKGPLVVAMYGTR